MGRLMIRATVVFALLGAAGLAAFAQAPSQEEKTTQQKSQKAAKPKVWTDDNIDSVRSPADDYVVQQQQKDAQQAAAKQTASQTGTTAVTAGPQPKTVQQADSMITEKQQLLASQKQYLQKLQQQLSDPETTGLERTRLEWRLKSYTATTQNTQADVTQLQAQKDALEKKAAAENASANGGAGSNQQ